MAGLAGAPRAEAGTYTVPFCNQSATGESTVGWTISTTAGTSPYFWGDNICRSGKVHRRFEPWTVPAGASNDMTFDAPAGTYVSQLQMFQEAYPRTAGAMAAIYSWQQDGSRSLTAAAYTGGSLVNDTYTFPLSGSKVIKLQESILCQGGANCDGRDSSGAYGNEDFWYGAVVHLVDPSQPTIDSVSGDGWVAEPVDGDGTIEWSTSDVGSGVKEA